MTDSGNFWVPRTLPHGKAALWRLGPVRVWLQRDKDEWLFAVERGENARIRDCSMVPLDVAPAGLEWDPIVLSPEFRDFTVMPVPPDRPVVLRGTRPILLPPKQKAVFFARAPVFLKFIAMSGDDPSKTADLKTIPSMIMSDTWFGDTMDGVLCYALRVSAARDHEDLEPGPNHAVCPVMIENKGTEGLTFEKVCLHLEHADIYRGRDHMWSSEINVCESGGGAPSIVNYSHGPPVYEDHLQRLHTAKEKPANLVRRSISWLAQSARQLY